MRDITVIVSFCSQFPFPENGSEDIVLAPDGRALISSVWIAYSYHNISILKV